MALSLKKAAVSNAIELHDLQIRSFQDLLKKYQDQESSPGSEPLCKTVERLHQKNSDYYFICLDQRNIGAIRIVAENLLCQLKQIYILPEYQGNGYAQQAIALAEALYPDAVRWELKTIKQEKKLCYLYQKMGYRRTGQEQPVKDGMDLVFFAKELFSNQ